MAVHKRERAEHAHHHSCQEQGRPLQLPPEDLFFVLDERPPVC